MSYYDGVGIDGVARPASWDAVIHVDVEWALRASVEFVAGSAGELHVVDGDGPVAACAAALEARVSRPYLAQATAISASRWLVGARHVSGVVSLTDVAGDEVSVCWIGERREQSVDGVEASSRFAPLEEFHRRGVDCAVVARRISGDLFLVELNLL